MRWNGCKVHSLYKNRRTTRDLISGIPVMGLIILFWCGLSVAQQARMLVQSSPLAGYQFHAAPDVWPQLKVGDTLTLMREPDNRHDKNAVRVEWQGQQLGYLPRTENQAIAAELDRGTPVEARIASLQAAKNPWQRILIDVYIRL